MLRPHVLSITGHNKTRFAHAFCHTDNPLRPAGAIKRRESKNRISGADDFLVAFSDCGHNVSASPCAVFVRENNYNRDIHASCGFFGLCIYASRAAGYDGRRIARRYLCANKGGAKSAP